MFNDIRLISPNKILTLLVYTHTLLYIIYSFLKFPFTHRYYVNFIYTGGFFYLREGREERGEERETETDRERTLM